MGEGDDFGLFEAIYHCRAMRRLDGREVPPVSRWPVEEVMRFDRWS